MSRTLVVCAMAIAALTTSGCVMWMPDRIHYTLDGSRPSRTHGSLYRREFSIQRDMTVKAMAFKSGMTDSDVATEIYKVDGPIEKPRFSKASGSHRCPFDVSITVNPSDATIHYTTNGSQPSTSSPVYRGAFTINKATVLRAFCSRPSSSNMVFGWISEKSCWYSRPSPMSPPLHLPC